MPGDYFLVAGFLCSILLGIKRLYECIFFGNYLQDGWQGFMEAAIETGEAAAGMIR